MDKSSRIYVAGHRGLVGSALLAKLQSEGYTKLIVRNQDALDLRDQLAVREFFREEKPEYVFLAAAKVGGILANNTYKAEFIYDNLIIAANVIEASYRYGTRKLLNLASSCIYPRLAPQPMKEEHLLTGALEPTNEPYAIAKIAAIKLCRYHNEQYGTDFLTAMPTNMYGPNDNFNLETSHVLPALIRKFHLAKLLMAEDFDTLVRDMKRRPLGFGIMLRDAPSRDEIIQVCSSLGIREKKLTLWGSGAPRREFLYSEDLADACLHMMLHLSYSQIGEFVNIGSGVDLRIGDLANLVQDIVGYHGEIEYDHSKPDGTPRKLLDISRIKALGWAPRISLAEGVQAAYHWYAGK